MLGNLRGRDCETAGRCRDDSRRIIICIHVQTLAVDAAGEFAKTQKLQLQCNTTPRAVVVARSLSLFACREEIGRAGFKKTNRTALMQQWKQ